MPKWIDITAYQRLEDGGRVLSASIADEVEIHVEASVKYRDIRLEDGDRILKIRIDEDWKIQNLIVDDCVEWSS